MACLVKTERVRTTADVSVNWTESSATVIWLHSQDPPAPTVHSFSLYIANILLVSQLVSIYSFDVMFSLPAGLTGGLVIKLRCSEMFLQSGPGSVIFLPVCFDKHERQIHRISNKIHGKVHEIRFEIHKSCQPVNDCTSCLYTTPLCYVPNRPAEKYATR